jgi:hypothetical protein
VSLYVLDRRQLTPLIDAWTGVAGFLSESRIFAVDKNNDPGLRLRLFGADGTPRATVAIPGRFPIRFGGEPVPGLLSIGIGSNREGPRGTLFIDAATGEVKRRELGVLPARGWGWKLAPAPGSAGTRLFWDAQGRLVRLDPGTGERHVLVATRGPDDRE